jgi:polar amino acid transport system substrate-binding protein
MRVGLSTFVPWVMRNKQGQLIGYEIDVATRLASDLNVKVEFVPTSWDGIIPALVTGKFDIIIGGLTPTPERERVIDFTHPDSDTGIDAVANTKLAAGRSTLADFNKPNVVITLRRGSAWIPAIKAKVPLATILLFDDDAQAQLEMLNGKADLFIASDPRPTFVNLDNPATTFKPFKTFLLDSNEAIGIRKNDPKFLKYLNDWVDARHADGFLQQRRKYWFASRVWLNQISASGS